MTMNNINTKSSTAPGPRKALYIRVSGREAAEEGLSIPNQLAKLRAYAKATGGTIVGEYVDGGKSGKRESTRKAYRQMMDDIDKWDAIVCLRLDRLHRNLLNAEALEVKLSKLGKKVVSLTEAVDRSNASGKLSYRILNVFAEHESDVASDRVKASHDYLLRNFPKANIGKPGYGYRVRSGRLVVNQREAAVVRRVFQAAAQGKTMSKIAADLRRIRRPQGAKRWSKTMVRKILRNRKYRGELRWGEHLILKHHPPIVGEKLFRHVQRLLDRSAIAARPDLHPPRQDASTTPWVSGRERRRQELRKYHPRLTYGYLIDENGRFRVYPPEAKVIKLVFDLAADNKSAHYIAKELDRLGAKPRFGGPAWSLGAVNKMLTNPAYVGETHYAGKRFLRTHQALVSYEQWDLVQLLMRTRGVERSKTEFDLGMQTSSAPEDSWEPSEA